MENQKKKIAILGSTGSIGTQALEVVSEQEKYLQVEVLTANSNADLLIKQAIQYKPNHVVIADESKYQQVKDVLDPLDIKVFAGNKAIEELMGITDADIVLTAMVGYSGLKPTIKAIENKKRIALANKETLVVAGELITHLCAENRVDIIPVDSEHSAIFQCLVGENLNSIDKVILTASGGPFRGKKRDELLEVTKAQALKHPNWSMGAKITIDSATLMNKGLEVIEAKWLFGLNQKQIDVVVHPQSIIHSMVEFNDGSIKAQMGLPDMKLPIHYAFFFPTRVQTDFKRMSFKEITNLTFEEPDPITFRNLGLAFEAMDKGGNMACILNAANEIAVEAFLQDKIKFLQIAELNEKCMNKVSFIQKPSIDDYVATDEETRIIAKSLLS
ncbi:MAG: 1-deoxy-D-xylulose-5-phosphate reductoisomerase [Bacteroidia bacterium]|nr:1-deoxy-D-xylulose-5-phosphate reductoisomerase [Bacteroidia bacterium]MCF8426212.1 1-deoxy-D-xylulose-5-phosphate reductoisomerase [Bacteroidia bacterium]MCF8446246.1 1-deoxy-D-xylulose-5-phosphate reductoisomerase [Bacteroidia bacterium]